MAFKIKPEAGDLFACDEEVKVVTINTVGAMGKGIAGSAKKRWPALFKEYRNRFINNNLDPEDVWLWDCGDCNVAMLATKIDWRNPSIPSLIIKNVHSLKDQLEANKIKSVAIPPLGMTNGWIRNQNDKAAIVLSIWSAFKDSSVEANLYLPPKLYEEIKEILYKNSK